MADIADLALSIQQKAHPLRNKMDLEPLARKLSARRIVMLGEASHGTREFYEWRTALSQLLMEKYGFSFIAVEGDWPPCWEVNRFLRNDSDRTPPERVLEHFNRWPTWMWANQEIVQLTTWMKAKKLGFYGLDVYSLFESIEAALEELERLNPFLARRVRTNYACFDPFRRDERAYARSLVEYPEGCQRQVVESLQTLLKMRLNDSRPQLAPELFDIQQNARVVANAENYYRTMMMGNEDSWNVRDRHMMETLNRLLDYHSQAKGIVWAHNTHIGDYRATDMVTAGQVNLGGLAREEWGHSQVALVGFGTYCGEVIASHAWDGPIQSKHVPPARKDSIEAAFHEAANSINEDSFFLTLDDNDSRSGPLASIHRHRAIGVVYEPEYERFGNYVPTSLANRYDAFIYIDRTQALRPLDVQFLREEIPETWPQGQ